MKLKDRLHFEFEPMSIGLADDIDTYLRKAKTEMDALPDDNARTHFANFVYIYLSTMDIVFNFGANEKAWLLAFQEKWNASKSMSPTERWEWRRRIPNAIIELWSQQYLAEQNLDDVDPAQLPEDKLTEEQKKELANPDSPFPSRETSLAVA